MASQAASISMEYMKKFLAELGRVFPEKKSFLGSCVGWWWLWIHDVSLDVDVVVVVVD